MKSMETLCNERKHINACLCKGRFKGVLGIDGYEYICIYKVIKIYIREDERV